MKKNWLIILIITALTSTSCSKDDIGKSIYTVTFDADGGSPVPDTQEVDAGNTVTAPFVNPAKAGYVFAFWYLSGSTTAYNFQTPVNNNITLYAKWQEETTVEYWQVTWNLNDGAWPADDNHATRVIKGGTLAGPNAPVKSGSAFEGWYKEAALTNKIHFPYDVSSITGNFTLYARWTTGNEEPGNNDPPTTLYIVGKDNSAACLWMVDLATNNTVKVSLNSYGEANDIVVSNGNIYVSGIKTNTTSKKQACYWKNGEATLLTNAGDHFEGTAIAVAGNDIYVSGKDYTSSGTKPCYWKNGTLSDLSSSVKYAWATDIVVSGSDVYVSGGNGSEDPCYWKNGIKTSLTRQNYSQAETRAIVASGTDIYVAGRMRYPGNWRACYWKNNTLVALTDGTNTAEANAVRVYNGKVYVAGHENTGTGTVYAACYWVDGTKITLEEGTLAAVQDIDISGSNVYAAGQIWVSGKNGSGNYKACYWINGVRVDLGDGTKESEALAIALSWE